MTELTGGWATTTLTLPEANSFRWVSASVTTGATQVKFAIPSGRINVSASTNYFLNVLATYTGTSAKGFGLLAIRRAR